MFAGMSRNLSSVQYGALNTGSVVINPGPITRIQITLLVVFSLVLGGAIIIPIVAHSIRYLVRKMKKAKHDAKANANLEAAIAACAALQADLRTRRQEHSYTYGRERNYDTGNCTTIYSFLSAVIFTSEKTESILYGLGITVPPEYNVYPMLDYVSTLSLDQQAEASI